MSENDKARTDAANTSQPAKPAGAVKDDGLGAISGGQRSDEDLGSVSGGRMVADESPKETGR